MLITCPSCGASYEVPDALVRDARNVRCARCQTQWSVTRRAGSPAEGAQRPPPARPAPALASAETFGLADDEELPPFPSVFDTHREPPPRPTRETPVAVEPVSPRIAPDERAEKAGRERGGTPLLVGLGWLATAVILIGLIWAGYQFREGVIHAWPASERLYAALGWRPTP